ncbi:YihY/virulence factor BrkB family protein [Kribbella sp. NPDC058693]|uniref:YihY/virulence factor BrkB family protein n=1 Tax=Kribbella jiaozuonensis TaxID=2575441 RepID=A0A4U3M079_9ACTN|nr:YihY/virulence factor BrkB family protein [Kribbella jiaozuonensis]TKK82075.1 YihY/virulence factor BrkB family protein [Kribbella jiaozuonensis]
MGTIKRVWARFSRTQLWRAWKRYGDQRGNRLAGATSFFGFLSLFPLIVLAAAIIGPLLGDDAIETLKKSLEQNLPGIGNNIDIDALITHAGTIGLISGIGLLLTGLGWIDAMRASIRLMHELDDQPGNAVQQKLTDLGALVGLGLMGLIATGASSVLTGLSRRIVDASNLDGTWLATWGLQLISIVVGIGAGALLFGYLMTALPRIAMPPKVLLIAALAGGIVFYLAQRLGNLYVSHVIGANAAYGALALPLALLVWIYLMTRVIMLVAAWTKEATVKPEVVAEPSEPVEEAEPLLLGPPGKRYKVVPIPERRADTVAVAAGAVLGATLTTLAVQAVRAVRSVRR